MNEKMIVKQDKDSRFMVVHKDPVSEEEKFFGGFCNEVECPGTEDESLAWEMESWVDRPEDGAMMFKTLQEARDCLGAIQEGWCKVILYGKGDVENSMLGSYWYPLKEFKSISAI